MAYYAISSGDQLHCCEAEDAISAAAKAFVSWNSEEERRPLGLIVEVAEADAKDGQHWLMRTDMVFEHPIAKNAGLTLVTEGAF